MDKDIRLGAPDCLKRLSGVILADPQIGIAVASARIPREARAFQRRYAREMPLCQMPVVEELTEIGSAPSGCFTIRKDLFVSLGGFHEELRRGEDSEFSLRVKKSGKKIVLAPHAFYYHRQPEDLLQLVKLQVRNGLGVAWVDAFFPELNIDVEPYKLDYYPQRKSFLSRFRRFVGEGFLALVSLKLLLFFSKSVYTLAYGFGAVKYRSARCKS